MVKSAPVPKVAFALSANSRALSDWSKTIFADAPVNVRSLAIVPSKFIKSTKASLALSPILSFC